MDFCSRIQHAMHSHGIYLPHDPYPCSAGNGISTSNGTSGGGGGSSSNSIDSMFDDWDMVDPDPESDDDYYSVSSHTDDEDGMSASGDKRSSNPLSGMTDWKAAAYLCQQLGEDSDFQKMLFRHVKDQDRDTLWSLLQRSRQARPAFHPDLSFAYPSLCAFCHL